MKRLGFLLMVVVTENINKTERSQDVLDVIEGSEEAKGKKHEWVRM